tara:strand:+ start:244 stop:420 length:177 start_codon:yes stop_codon:yes gene_type:complete
MKYPKKMLLQLQELLSTDIPTTKSGITKMAEKLKAQILVLIKAELSSSKDEENNNDKS